MGHIYPCILLFMSVLTSVRTCTDDQVKKTYSKEATDQFKEMSDINWDISKKSWEWTGNKAIELIVTICGPQYIPDHQLLEMDACSYRNVLNETVAKTCYNEVHENQKPEEIRRIKCRRKTRDEYNQQFMLCYMREDPDDAAKRYEYFKGLSKDEKKQLMKGNAKKYLDCLENAFLLPPPALSSSTTTSSSLTSVESVGDQSS